MCAIDRVVRHDPFLEPIAMTAALVAFLCTLVAAGLVSFLTPVPPFVPFPELDPDPLPAGISASVSDARRRQQTAEEGQDRAEREAARHFGSVARLTIDNNAMKQRIIEMEEQIEQDQAKIIALNDLSLPRAYEMVAEAARAAAEQSSGGDDDTGGGAASTAYTPQAPSKP